MLKITDYIFDLDGTLAESHPGICLAAKLAVAEVLPGVEVPEFSPYIGPPIREIFKKALNIDDESVLQQLAKAYRRHYDDSGCCNASLYPKVAETLSVLRSTGSRCFLLTNKPMRPTERMLRHLAIGNYFAAVCSPDSRQPNFRNKAEAIVFLINCQSLSCTSTIMVGDSEDDQCAAIEAGVLFWAVGYGYGQAWRMRNKCHRVLASFSDILII